MTNGKIKLYFGCLNHSNLLNFYCNGTAAEAQLNKSSSAERAVPLKRQFNFCQFMSFYLKVIFSNGIYCVYYFFAQCVRPLTQ